jgi:AcrR family transcriptional regulator
VGMAKAEAGTRFRRLPRPVREQQMLDAAIEVFSRRGYRVASMDEIAEAAGISKPMIYAYLGSKDELFAACIAREAGRLVDAISAVVGAGGTPAEQLWHALHAFFSYVDEHRGGWLVLYRQARGDDAPFAEQVVTIRANIAAVVASLLGQAMDAEGVALPPERELSAVANALVGAAESLADWMVDNAGETPTATATRLMNLVWMGFDSLLRGARWHPPFRSK